MKLEELEVGMKVRDNLFRGPGVVVKVLKTRAHIQWRDKLRIHDVPHIRRFLYKDRGRREKHE